MESTRKDRQAGAKVTPEMIEAGLKALSAHMEMEMMGATEGRLLFPRDLVVAILKAAYKRRA